MAYSNPYIIKNGLTLDFTAEVGDPDNDFLIGVNSAGEMVRFETFPGSAITGSNLTEATSSVLTITGGTGAKNRMPSIKLSGYRPSEPSEIYIVQL